MPVVNFSSSRAHLCLTATHQELKMSIGEGRISAKPVRQEKELSAKLSAARQGGRAPLLLGPREAAVYYSIWHSGSYHGVLSEGSVVKI
jgi:hypothetical protein